jgi:hypothetical protein
MTIQVATQLEIGLWVYKYFQNYSTTSEFWEIFNICPTHTILLQDLTIFFNVVLAAVTYQNFDFKVKEKINNISKEIAATLT